MSRSQGRHRAVGALDISRQKRGIHSILFGFLSVSSPILVVFPALESPEADPLSSSSVTHPEPSPLGSFADLDKTLAECHSEQHSNNTRIRDEVTTVATSLRHAIVRSMNMVSGH